eukprot:3343855-Prymnesium_polylepis.2
MLRPNNSQHITSPLIPASERGTVFAALQTNPAASPHCNPCGIATTDGIEAHCCLRQHSSVLGSFAISAFERCFGWGAAADSCRALWKAAEAVEVAPPVAPSRMCASLGGFFFSAPSMNMLSEWAAMDEDLVCFWIVLQNSAPAVPLLCCLAAPDAAASSALEPAAGAKLLFLERTPLTLCATEFITPSHTTFIFEAFLTRVLFLREWSMPSLWSAAFCVAASDGAFASTKPTKKSIAELRLSLFLSCSWRFKKFLQLIFFRVLAPSSREMPYSTSESMMFCQPSVSMSQ